MLNFVNQLHDYTHFPHFFVIFAFLCTVTANILEYLVLLLWWLSILKILSSYHYSAIQLVLSFSVKEFYS